MNANEVKDIIKTDAETGEIYVAQEIVEKIRANEIERKRVEREYNEYKKALIQAMEKYGVEKIDSDRLLVMYVGEHEQFRVDSAKLKKEYPLVYEDVTKVSNVKASVRITVRADV